MILIIQNQPADDRPRKVFVSYSHADQDWKDRIVEVLRPLETEQRIAMWHDRKLVPGEEWDGTIRRELDDADVILFLVSQPFIDSKYCRDIEVKRAVTRSNDGEAMLVPIIVGDCKFEDEPFARFQAYPLTGAPLENSIEQDPDLSDLREKFRLALLGWWYPRHPRAGSRAHALWQLRFRAAPGTHLPADAAVLRKLRAAAEEPGILYNGHGQDLSSAGGTGETSAAMILEGPTAAFVRLEKLQNARQLSAELGVEVLEFKIVLGADMRMATELAHSTKDALELHEDLLLTPSDPDMPDVPQMLVVRDEEPGWMLVMPSRVHAATPKAVFPEVQALFTEYFGTMLAAPEGRLTVNLSTYDPEDTLPPSLQRTRLGHDLIDQDCLLKQYAASLLHPDSATGAAYWQALRASAREIYGTDSVPLSAYQKVWIVPGSANSVHEKSPEQLFNFEWPERFAVRPTDRACTVEYCKLNVLCEADYRALEHHSAVDLAPNEDAKVRSMNAASVGLFRDLILPTIVTEVNEGKHFTKLRQIYWAFVLATWVRFSLKDLPAYAPLFQVIDQGVPEAFGVERSDDWNLKNSAVYARYIKLFAQGVFRCARPESGTTDSKHRARIYFSGGAVFEVGAISQRPEP